MINMHIIDKLVDRHEQAKQLGEHERRRESRSIWQAVSN